MNDINKYSIPGYEFYERDTGEVARELIGKVLIKSNSNHNHNHNHNHNQITAGIITETEAYYGEEDPASHAFKGITPRSRIMFEKAGHAYVYFCYGMYYLLNVVTEKPGKAGAVLIRAVRPLYGIELMAERRSIKDIKGNIRNVKRLTDGPGKLTISFGITLADNGKDLTKKESSINILDFKINNEKFRIRSTGRIGIKKGCEELLRFEATEIDESPYKFFK